MRYLADMNMSLHFPTLLLMNSEDLSVELKNRAPERPITETKKSGSTS